MRYTVQIKKEDGSFVFTRGFDSPEMAFEIMWQLIPSAEKAAGFLREGAEDSPAGVETARVVCAVCGRTFKNKRSLKSHQWQVRRAVVDGGDGV